MAVERSLVPVIDLEKFKEEKEKLLAAVTGLGCFRVINHGIPEKVVTDMKASVGRIFELPSEVKHLNTDIIVGSGYVKPNQYSPLYEGLGIYNASLPTDVHAFCSLLGISSPDRETLSTYTSKLHGLIVDLASKVAECLGIEYCSFKEWCCHLRMHRYNFTKETISASGTHAHTDGNFMTLLLEDESNDGLEVMDSNGNSIAVHSVPGTFLIFCGDIGKVWSNGRLNNVKHNVICKKGEPRTTVTIFMLAPKDNKVEPEAKLIDSEHPRLYRSFNYMEYRMLRFSTLSINGELLLHWAVDGAATMT